MTNWDVVVIGQGIFGCAARAYLAQRGVRVLGLEQSAAGHDGGSSHGESRVIRQANFENPRYAELISRAMTLWPQLEGEAGEVLERCGVLEAAPSASAYLGQTLMAAVAGAVPIEPMTPAGVRDRFPAITLPEPWSALLQPRSGYLKADAAIARYLQIAAGHGSELRTGVRVRSVEERGDGVEIRTDAGDVITAAAAIVTTGPWIGELIPQMRPHLRLTRQVLAWYQPPSADLFLPGRFPVFLFATDIGFVYGFPHVPGFGVKIALHEHGSVLAHPNDARQDAEMHEARPLRASVKAILAALPAEAARVRTCIYANTPDEEFVVGKRPGADRIIFASACSGHGFKFASAIGESLADLACGAPPSCDLSAFGLDRFK